MNNKPKIHTVRVFVNENGAFGSPLGIVLDEKNKLDKNVRQQISKDAGFSETAFINDSITGDINVYNPLDECPFSMFAALGTAWYIKNILKNPVDHLQSKNERIYVSNENDLTFVKTKIPILPPWHLIQYQNINELENIKADTTPFKEHTIVWCWLDKNINLIRARTFAPDWGIIEDEANGSGSIKLASKLQDNITVIHGKGSVLYSKYTGLEFGEVGGRVKMDKTINYEK